MSRPLPFVLAATDHGPMIVSRTDVHVLPTGQSYGVGNQLFLNGAYEPDEVTLMKEILSKLHAERKGSLIALDCGANIGVHSVEMGKYLAGWGQVIAFEPQERLFYALCGNIALGNHFNVSARQYALGAVPGSISIPRPDYTKAGSFGSLELRFRPGKTEYIGQRIDYSPTKAQAVSLVSLDSLTLPRVDFIKIDVEGMEMDVLEGSRNIISEFRPTFLIEHIKCEPEALESFFAPLSYDLTRVGMNTLAQFHPE